MGRIRVVMLIAVAALALPAATTASTGCPSDLVGYWAFDNGNADDSAGANNGTVLGAQPTAGAVGQAFDFDGIDDYITIPGNPTPTNDFTAVFWIYSRNDGSVRTPLMIATVPGSYTFHGFYFEHHGGNFYVNYDEDGVSPWVCWDGTVLCGISPSGDILNGWHQVAAVKSSTLGLMTYLDGELTNSYPARTENVYFGSGEPIEIGRHNPAHRRYFDGKIDEVAIFDKALTGDEIGEYYRRALAGVGYCGPADADGDGIEDDLDRCDGTPAEETGDVVQDPASPFYGCGPSERDLDGDGIKDNLDACPNNLPEEIPEVLAGLGCVPASPCDPNETDADGDGFVDAVDVCPWTDAAKAPASPVIAGCSCYQILQWKPGNNKGELKKGCSQDTLDEFSGRNGWAKEVPLPPR
ncbi:MAG: LamG-like jellyroll fold domain-containing protein [Elusimicrobiota bacterium]